MKVDYSPAAVTSRIRQVGELLDICRGLDAKRWATRERDNERVSESDSPPDERDEQRSTT